jgi:small acid-soluble spore protein D (minor alpha/beta-type SASP)
MEVIIMEKTAGVTQADVNTALNKFKFEVANEIGVPLKEGYNGDLTSAQNGNVGGQMVKKMIEAQKNEIAGNTK